MRDDLPTTELDAVQLLLTTLNRFDESTRLRILKTVATFFGADLGASQPRLTSRAAASGSASGVVGSSEERQISPKEFLFEKKPQTNIERVASLAYYLTHYRDQPHFKTLDLSKLNTEAAQPKFTNAAYATNDALKAGLLAQASKSQRQISALGEQFVLALPDRDAARAVLASRIRRKARKRATNSGATPRGEPEDEE
jgi:hypothetical protein